MKHHASASKAELFGACQYWARPDVALPYDPPGEPARLGTAVHAVHEAVLRGEEADPAKAAASEKVDGAKVTRIFDRLRPWLVEWIGEQQAAGRSIFTERKLVFDAYAGRTRILTGGGHRGYGHVAIGELPGQGDAFAVGDGELVVYDLKTGNPDYVSEARVNRQVRTLATAVAAVDPSGDDPLAVAMRAAGPIHTVSAGLVFANEDRVYSDFAPLRTTHLEAQREELAAAFEGLEKAEPQPGPHCTESWCPLRRTCPGVVGAVSTLVKADAAPLTSIRTPDDVRRARPLLRMFRELAAGAEAQIAEVVEREGRVDLGTGYELRMCQGEARESFSKERTPPELIEQLRQVGALAKGEKPRAYVKEVKVR